MWSIRLGENVTILNEILNIVIFTCTGYMDSCRKAHSSGAFSFNQGNNIVNIYTE